MAVSKTINTKCSNGVSFGHKHACTDNLGNRDTMDILSVGGTTGDGIGPWKVIAKGANTLFVGVDVNSVYHSVTGLEIMTAGDQAKQITLGTPITQPALGTDTLADLENPGDGTGVWYVISKGASSGIASATVGQFYTATGTEVLTDGDSVCRFTLGPTEDGADVEYTIYDSYRFDFDTAYQLVFIVSITSAAGAPKTTTEYAITYPAVDQVLVTFSTPPTVGDVISVIAQRASATTSVV